MLGRASRMSAVVARTEGAGVAGPEPSGRRGEEGVASNFESLFVMPPRPAS